jgi:signal transduction histidine kinase
MVELVIRRSGEIDPKKFGSEYAPIIYKSSSDMLDLVNKLLDAAKIDAGKFEVAKQPTDLRALLHERAAFYASAVADAHLELAVNVHASVPEKILCDPAALAQVINNFLSNAIKFTKSGGTIALEAFRHVAGADILAEAKEAGIQWKMKKDEKGLSGLKDAVVIAVTDSGMGIRTEDIPLLFNKFKQFRAAAVEKKGTGLGLAIAKGIIEAHGGTVAVASEEGAGTTFAWTIPAA